MRAAPLDSYLVLLQVGFTLPFVLPRTRCALTTPFHPYRSTGVHLPNRRYIFCGTVHRLAPSRRYLAPCPVEPGLSSAVYREATHLDAGRNTAAAARPTPGKTIVLTGPDGKFSLNLHHFQPIQAAGGNNRFSVRREAGRKPVQLQPAAGNH